VPAVRAGNLYALTPGLIGMQSPRLLDGIEEACKDLDEARARPGS
jgi:hypothetical protein